ncbi:hypothetical protein SKAU_G00277190 [Synaphobranchus kaupii]|uniref:Uncharacterized protein n=1 Tax=Synaphobranchus kaupii TaxID=118154 RepID=A0A9Q1F1N3_SYNKA|nr:hypothetical protein SKAU_G00277190 [Synaphobranchus kaupii]
MATEQPAGSTEIQYPVEVTNAQSRKQYKLSLLKSSPESLYCDYAHIEDRKIKNNLIFHTEHPTAWHTAVLFIQGSEASLHSFEDIFLLLKDEADKLETTSPEPDINAESTTTDSTVNTSEPPNTTPAPTNSTPVAPKYMEQMQETLALLEQDFTEFRELTMARLCEHSLSQQLRDEVCQVKRECRMALSEAMAELKELQEGNGALRAQLASFKEDMTLLEPS